MKLNRKYHDDLIVQVVFSLFPNFLLSSLCICPVFFCALLELINTFQKKKKKDDDLIVQQR